MAATFNSMYFFKKIVITLLKKVFYLRWNERHVSAYFGTLMTQL